MAVTKRRRSGYFGSQAGQRVWAMETLRAFCQKKDVVFSVRRYAVDAMGAMAQGLFASLLIGTIVKTLGEQLGLAFLVTAGGYAAAVAGPAMAA